VSSQDKIRGLGDIDRTILMARHILQVDPDHGFLIKGLLERSRSYIEEQSAALSYRLENVDELLKTIH
jgi:hypothetical protein